VGVLLAESASFARLGALCACPPTLVEASASTILALKAEDVATGPMRNLRLETYPKKKYNMS
jgi:hypothetical protein